jgi:hypothetical protein
MSAFDPPKVWRKKQVCAKLAVACFTTFIMQPCMIEFSHSNARLEGLNGLFQAARARARG